MTFGHEKSGSRWCLLWPRVLRIVPQSTMLFFMAWMMGRHKDLQVAMESGKPPGCEGLSDDVNIGEHGEVILHQCGFLGVRAAFSPAWSRNSSAFSCCDAFESPFPSHDAFVGVAAHLMHLATTAEFWGDEGSHWRVPAPEFAGKQEAVSPPTCSSEVAVPNTLDGRRGRFALVRRRPVGRGHDTGVTPSRRRISAPSCC